MSTYRILIVEDEAIIAEDLNRRLRALGHEPVGIAATGHQACDLAARLKPDLVLMDVVLKGDMDGIQAAQWIRSEQDLPVVYLTSHADPATVNLACKTEPFGYILKPIDARELRVAIEVAVCRHRSEAKVRQMERWMTTTLKSIGDGVIATDGLGKIVMLNSLACQMTGWTENEAIGRDFEEVFRIHDAQTGGTIPNVASQAMREGIVVHIGRHSMLQPRDHPPFYIDDSAAPIRGPGGDVRGAVVVFRDATERVQGEERMRRLNVDLEHQVEMRTEELRSAVTDLEQFAASVSHDLRAPLRTLQGFAALLTDHLYGSRDEESMDLLSRILQSVDHMGTLIEAFERLARVQRHDLRLQPVAMGDLVSSCLAELWEKEKYPALSITIGVLPESQGDPQLLRQVWMNLLSNAVKYSSKVPRPVIEVGARVDAEELVYFVRDNGAGFEMEHAERLFSPFQRFHAASEFEGHGMGLATCKRVVQRHGGRIWAESKPDVGSTFFFAIPQPRPFRATGLSEPGRALASMPRKVTEPEEGLSRRLLIVEDEAIIASDLKSRLTRLGYVVVGIAATGDEALHLARTRGPALVLMDIRLKGPMDGIEVAHQIGLELHTPVVFVTSHSDRATFERAKGTSSLGYVVKPFQDRELAMAIELALAHSEAERRVVESEQWLSATLRSIGDGVVATDASGRIVFMNPAAEAILGTSEQEVTERELTSVFRVLDPVTQLGVSSRSVLALRNGTPNPACQDAVLLGVDGKLRPIQEASSLIRNPQGRIIGGILVFRNISERKSAEANRERLIAELQASVDQVKTLSGLLPVCAWCRKIRDDAGYWQQFEEYVRTHTQAAVTHSICPVCAERVLPHGDAPSS